MSVLTDELQAIKDYVLDPDEAGGHLREMVDAMAGHEVELSGVSPADREHLRQEATDRAAETIAAFIHLAWGGAGVEEYARRSYEMLCALRDRMRGMDPAATWHYAIDALNFGTSLR